MKIPGIADKLLRSKGVKDNPCQKPKVKKPRRLATSLVRCIRKRWRLADEPKCDKCNDRNRPEPTREVPDELRKKIFLVQPALEPILPEPVSVASKMVWRVRQRQMSRPKIIADNRC